jgi:quercetin dioxygenase-like cupin family protein
MMQETIRIGGLELRFLQSEANGQGSLTLFEMTIQPNARMPIAHHHETWDETVYGLVGVSTWRVDGEDILLRAGETVFIKRGVVHASEMTRRDLPPASASSRPACSVPPISGRWRRWWQPVRPTPRR